MTDRAIGRVTRCFYTTGPYGWDRGGLELCSQSFTGVDKANLNFVQDPCRRHKLPSHCHIKKKKMHTPSKKRWRKLDFQVGTEGKQEEAQLNMWSPWWMVNVVCSICKFMMFLLVSQLEFLIFKIVVKYTMKLANVTIFRHKIR